MTDQDRQCCADGHACTREAVSAVRLRPTRADLPYCACCRLAQFWAGPVSATTLKACSVHLAEVKRLGSVDAERALGDETVVRTVKGDE